ncbi:hypothetical protein [Erwinia rhapontici]|uniref:hypothetical protein n=1 Tax=Erwinia rhapontici TaxID=55212 RepID=UPI003BA3A9FB
MQPSQLSEPTKHSPLVARALYSLASAQAMLAARVVIGLCASIFLMLLVALITHIFESSSRWAALLTSNAAVLIFLAVAFYHAQRICQWRADIFAPPLKCENAPTQKEPPTTLYQRLSALIPVNV